MPVTTARCALCQRFTNCIQQSYTTDSTTDLTVRKGFRRSYQTLNHLATQRLLEQKCWEWGFKMWVATVDFMKGFDSLSHQSLWKALEKCGIESQYISLLRTKQGGPLSSLLFNTVLRMALRDGVTRW